MWMFPPIRLIVKAVHCSINFLTFELQTAFENCQVRHIFIVPNAGETLSSMQVIAILIISKSEAWRG